MLYQLSYLAVVWSDLATPTGLEPATSAVTGRRANQLRYGAWWDQTDCACELASKPVPSCPQRDSNPRSHLERVES